MLSRLHPVLALDKYTTLYNAKNQSYQIFHHHLVLLYQLYDPENVVITTFNELSLNKRICK